jgi:hypothetical protein
MCGKEIEVGVKRQFDDKRRPLGRELSQPKPMRHTSESHDSMPAVQSLPEVGVGQLAEIEIIRAADQGRARVADPEYGRQRLWCPEDSLLIESLVRVSRENKAPIAIETSGPLSKAIEHAAACDSLLGNRYCGEDTPRQNRRFRQLPFARKLRAIANQTPTS